MKKAISIFLTVLCVCSFAGCSNAGSSASAGSSTGTVNNASNFDTNKDISVVSREDGSGTRGAFIELFDLEQKNEDGTKKDLTTKEAVIAKQTDVMMANIAGNKFAIGYISLGSLNETVKAVQIDGVTASAENVKNGTYSIVRPFNIVTKGDASGLAKDFIDYILSADGQEVVGKSYIKIADSATAYAGSKPSGKIMVAGSSSVTPVMEKLKEAYLVVNPNAAIEIQQTDSSAGIKSAIDGSCDIGMASRELKDSEKAELKSIQIALDGIAVIANKENTVTSLTKDQVKAIFTGEMLKWSETIK